MSQPTGDPREESLYFYDSNPHTAIPDWLALRDDISYEARNLVHRLLIWKVGGLLPPRPELAKRCGVDPRTIARWLDELREKGAITTRLVGRRLCFRFNTTHDTWDHDPMSHDPMSHDPMCHGSGESNHRDLPHQESKKATNHDTWDHDSPVGGGGGSDSQDKDPPPTTNARETVKKITAADITTTTGRWMVKEGFNIRTAHRLQHLPLNPCIDDFERRWNLGQRHGAIALAWEVEPPAAAAPAPAPSVGPWTFSESERDRYRALGFAFGSDPIAEGSADEGQ